MKNEEILKEIEKSICYLNHEKTIIFNKNSYLLKTRAINQFYKLKNRLIEKINQEID